MGTSIELLTRLHSAKTVNWESVSGRSSLTADVINGAIALAEKNNTIGSYIVKAKYLDDIQALQKLNAILNKLVDDENIPPRIRPALADLIYRVLLEKPLKPQYRRVISAWSRYGNRANRSQKIISDYQKAIKSLKNAKKIKVTEKEREQVQVQIDLLKRRADSERNQLRKYAEEKALSTIACPRCRTVGSHRGGTCGTCDGKGVFKQSSEHMYNHFRHCDVRVSKSQFIEDIYPMIERTLNELYSRESDVIKAIDKNLALERMV
ncbi:TIGR02642 family protein [Vibrio sp. 99-8-1]|uniref:TIGR02642 family protein n=1 Tax=Vibrio sp. 99-8-1 TaxID=2607602 RepID=UPI001493C4F4|nr:TIGR02642 family protein [Vibrio sp. 99-8-1]NOI66907.1 hypothetical protein [Vibrio sp. 99-8-1]